MTAFRRSIVTGAVIAISVPAWAGQSQPERASDADDPARPQVQTFELVLRTAVETGGQNFAKRATQMVPVIFSAGDSPLVNGVAVREMGLYLFQVQVPVIWPTIQVMNMMLNRGPQVVRATPPPARQVSNGAGVVADGAVAPDPMTAEPIRPDLEREYASQVRDALIDAMLDNSGGLPMAAGDTLLVVASGTDPVGPNPLYRQTSKKLVLSIRGADVADFRQGKITRDEAKGRIKESHF